MIQKLLYGELAEILSMATASVPALSKPCAMTKERRPRLADGMLLIAITALSLALVRRILQTMVNWGHLRFDSFEHGMESVVFALAYSVSATMAAATFGLVCIRLIRPRPCMQRLARQPGAVAGWAVVIATSLSALDSTLLYELHTQFTPGGAITAFPLNHRLFDRVLSTLLGSFSINGYAVAVAWIIQALGKRYRPEKTWIDRLGRACGFYWLAMIPSDALLNWFSIRIIVRGWS